MTAHVSQVAEIGPILAVAEHKSQQSGDSASAEKRGDAGWSITARLNLVSIAACVFGLAIAAAGWFSLGAVEAALAQAGISNAAATDAIDTGRNALIIILLMATGWMVLGSFRIGQDIGKAARRLATILDDLAAGETQMHVPYQSRGDALGQIARAIEIGRAKTIRAQAIRDHSQDLTAQRVEADKEHAALRLRQATSLQDMVASFEQMIGSVVSNVAAASSQLNTTATSLSTHADKSASQISSVNSAMDEASQGVTAAAAASDEFAMSIGEISRQASSSAELARKATDSAESANATIEALANSAEEVGAVVDLIQTIAQRTNLLALNASIEAARGGESGRGFAVVASEVKDLASRTSKATENVSRQIADMQRSTAASVDALRSIGTQIRQLESTAVSIASAVDQQAVAGQDLARSIDRAAHGADEAAVNMSKVSGSVSATGDSARQVLDAASDLEQQASQLRSHVSTWHGNISKMDLLA